MGMMKFQLPPNLSTDAVAALKRACVVGGPDSMPYPTQVGVDRDLLTVSRNVDESGCLLVPWEVEGAGQLMCSTATLIERATPYNLQVELARGRVNQLRNQAADWQLGGVQVADPLLQQIRAATRAFTRALTRMPSPQSVDFAQSALTLGFDASDQLALTYLDQLAQFRHQRLPYFDTTLGCRLGATVPQGQLAADLTKACNAICLPLSWGEIEPVEATYHWETSDAVLAWASEQGLAVSAGPLVDFSTARLPDWLWLWERDLSSIAGFMCDYVETTVKRYCDRIRTWQLTAASNYAAVLSLGEDELLWLTVRLVEAARQVDPSLELIIGIAQPWGEYMALEDRTHSPFVFADTLIRAGLTLAALDVELVMGVAPRGSHCRDLLETLRMLDLYSLLGVPLQVTLAYPSDVGPDPKADPELAVAAGRWRDGFSPETQAEWAALFTEMAVCKPSVRAVQWAHFSDAEPHQFPHGGLVDANGNIKPALQQILQVREKHLGS
jgi:hypothetical protein